MKRAFTLVELLVVVAMLAVLMGAIGSGVSQARKRAQIAKATQDAKEITNAILAFENIAKNRSLENYVCSWTKATESSLKMILGGGATESGDTAPVLYNAQLRNGAVLDPWGTEYEFMIKKVSDTSRKGDGQVFVTAPILPNFNRLTDEERQ